MKTLEQLDAVEEIKRLKARYCRFIDTKRWEDWGALFTSDASMDCSDDVAEGSGADPIIFGRTVIADQVSRLVGPARTVHQVHSPDIELASADAAHAFWAMEDWVAFPDGIGAPFRSMHGYGYYEEIYARQEGRWFIAALRLTRLRRDFEPAI